MTIVLFLTLLAHRHHPIIQKFANPSPFSSVNSVPLCFHNTKSNRLNESDNNDWKLKHRGTEDTEGLVAFSEECPIFNEFPYDL